ncbi:MAG: hypothetical protein AABX85_04130 [Nanoarchaeota archaeon]
MKKNVLILSVFIFLLVFTSAIVSAEFPPVSVLTADTDCSAKDNYNVGDSVYINVTNFGTGSHIWSIIGQGNSCNPNVTIAGGSFFVPSYPSSVCFNAYNITLDNCGEYNVTVYDWFFGTQSTDYHVDNEVIYVPEFGLIAGTITIMGALLAFLLIRKN